MNTLEQITEIVNQTFTGVIGQTRAVGLIKQALISHLMGASLFKFLLTGPAGNGKSHLLRAIATAYDAAASVSLETYRSPDVFSLPGEELTAYRRQLANGYCATSIDEAHEFGIRKNVSKLAVYRSIKCLTDSGYQSEAGNVSFAYDEDLFVSLPANRIAIIMATNFLAKLPDREAIVSRFGSGHIELDAFSESELLEILQRMLDAQNIRANEETLLRIAKCGRGLARPMEKIVDWSSAYLAASGKATRTLNKSEVKDALLALGMFPWGLQPYEVAILKECAKGEGRTVTDLSLLTRTEKKLVQEGIAFLSIENLIKTNRGRISTSTDGNSYLSQIKSAGFQF